MQLSRSPKRAAVIGGTMLLACLVGLKLAAQSGDPLISALLGSWKLNVATSKLPGPPPQSSVGRIERTDDGFFKHIQDEVDAQGKAVHYETSAKLDGKDYPTQGSQPPVTRAYKRVDDRTLGVEHALVPLENPDTSAQQTSPHGAARVAHDVHIALAGHDDAHVDSAACGP